MEIFKYDPLTIPGGLIGNAQIVQGATSKMWTERYAEPGEFEIKAPLSSGLRDFLPLGCFISHTDTLELMIVENHEIQEKGKEDPQLVITGRSAETFLENRIIGVNRVRQNAYVEEYIMASQKPEFQATKLINDHIYNPPAADDAVTGWFAVSSLTTGAVEAERVISHGTSVHKAVLDILATADLGISTLRRNSFTTWPAPSGSNTESWIMIYHGKNKTANVIFSWKGGDLNSAEYLFTQKKNKTTAFVVGRYCWAIVDTVGYTKYDRRIMYVDGSDIDDYLDTKPVTFSPITIKMRQRGRDALAAHNSHAITRTDISNVTNYRFRRDYNVGDLVSLDGNFGQMATMRVIEYVEIEDENGESGHPTLDTPVMIWP